jgi:hypothetical protein
MPGNEEHAAGMLDAYLSHEAERARAAEVEPKAAGAP